MKKAILLPALVAVSLTCFSQTDSVTNRKAVHYLGVQANQLLRQLVNFGGSTTVISNPYLFVWSVNSRESGWGLNTGMGFNLNEFTDGDATNKRNSSINDLNFRVGFEKKSTIGKKWMTSWGFDVVHQNLSNTTTTTTIFNPNTPTNNTVVDTKSSTTAWGFGPRFTLSFQISNKILLGTEATYYYRSGSNSIVATTTNTFTTTNQFGNQVTNTTTNKTDNSSDFKSFQFNLPVALFLMLKF